MWNVTDWQEVVFSDESVFVLGTDDNRVRVWKRPDERYNFPHTARTAGPFLNGLLGAIFQQDNARPHAARVSQDFLRHFQTLPWPARFPDLSPVEHVGYQLKRQMSSCHSVHDLELAVQDLWAHLPQDNIRLFKKGNSYREIAKIVDRSHSCVQKIIGRFKSDGLIENKSGRERGRKSILSDVAKRKVLKDIKIDPKLSAVKLAAETSRIMGRSVSAETVRNVIRHSGYSSRVARKKPFISLQNQKKRLEFAKTHQLKTDNFWKKVIFSDESKFNIFGSGGRRTVWRKPSTALDPKNLRHTVKHGGFGLYGFKWGWKFSFYRWHNGL
ncbi:transposable element Tcb2 transposase [Trichonephila clavipes]|nr:transposable element Tcb2 transposase [Trichonephila clavipes]